MEQRVTRLTLGIDGMTCGSCESRIERAVGGLEGVRSVKASASLGEVEVSFDASRTDAAAIEAAVQTAATGTTFR